MFLPILLTVLLAVPGAVGPCQQSGSGYEVTGAPGVSSSSLLAVEEAVGRGLKKLAPLFPGMPERDFAVAVHQTAASLPGDVGEWHRGVPGLALLVRQQIHLIRGEMDPDGPGNLQGVVEHELAHILLHQFAGPGAQTLPRWFHEGLAQELSGAIYLGAREEDLVFRARTGTLLSFGDLGSEFPRDDEFRLREAYAQSFLFVAYLRRQLGHATLLEVVQLCGEDLDFRRAFVERTRRSVVSFEEGWIEYLENESGAGFRVILRNCFSYMISLAVPLLALAVIRRLARDKRAQEKLAAAEAGEEQEDLQR